MLGSELVPRPRESTARVWVTLHFRVFGGSKNSALKFETGDLQSSTTVGPDLVTMVAPGMAHHASVKWQLSDTVRLWEYAYLDGLTAS